MNQIYLFEIFMDQLIFMEDINNTEIVAHVTGGDLLNIQILLSRNVVLPNQDKIPVNPMVEKFFKGGKSVFFSSSPQQVIEAFETNLTVTIKEIESNAEFGSVKLRWNDEFKKEVMQLSENIKNIRYIEQFEIMRDEEKIAKLDLNMVLLCYGETIEMSIANVMSSAATIPIMIPKYGNAKQNVKGNLPTDPWASLFNSPHKAKNSLIDVDLMLYAQMAGIVTDEILESKRLSVGYINDHLCGHKSCPGAVKFRDWGIGPLASPGSGLGTIGSLSETKTTGKYGISQAYGTMNPYGAYGLFVNTSKPTKTKCNSPTCPFTDPDELEEEEQERLIGESLDERLEESCCLQNKNKSVKCTCKCCGKMYVKKFPSTCEDPLCPSVPKKKDYKCKGPICPHTDPNEADRIDCGGEECPAIQEEDATCRGAICPYSAPNIKKCCVTDSCPKETARRLRGGADNNSNLKKCRCCNRLMRRKTRLTNLQKRIVGGADDCDSNCINADGSYIYEYGAASTRNWRSQSNLPNNCNDPNCLFKHMHESNENEAEGPVTPADFDDLTTTDSSWAKPESPQVAKCTTFSPETCIIKKCQMEPNSKRQDYEVIRGGPESDAKIQRLTRLVNEANQNLLVTNGGRKNLDTDAITKNLLNTKHMLSDVVSFEDDDDEMIYLIARLLGQREFSHSMNNFYMDDFFSESRLKERNDQATKHLVSVNDDSLAAPASSTSKQNQLARVKHKRRGPCEKDTCNYMKYKTCSECGGISKSGATCDNSDVSFSYISYSDIAEESIDESGERHSDRKPPNISNDSKMNHKQQAMNNARSNADKKHVDIKEHKKRKNRFIYHCGENYPGIRLGHKYCRTNDRDKNNVPFDMGWLWSVKPEGIRRRRKNWKPGMINTIINDRIIEYRKKRGIPDPPQLKMIVPTKKRQRNQPENDSEPMDEEIVPKPTLIIQKKEGSYLITLNPLKDPKTLAPFENPYMQCKPMQFVITRPQPPPKKDLDSYDDCLCNKDDVDSKCPSSSSSESELNIEFTTPAGLIYPEEMKKPPNVIHTETQFKEADFNCQDCPIIMPKKFSKKGKSKQKKK